VTAYVVSDDYKAGLPELAAKAEAEAAIEPVVAVASPPPVAIKVQQEESFISGVTVIGLALGLLAAPFLARKFKGMNASEVVAYLFDLLRAFVELVIKLLSSLVNLVTSNKNKILPGK
jgi:hypothetical protein